MRRYTTRRLLSVRLCRGPYLREAVEVRDALFFACLYGGASRLEFRDAQKSYRDTELSWPRGISSIRQ